MILSKTLLFSTLVFFSTALLSNENKPLSVKEKKENFRNLIVPAIDTVYKELKNQYIEIAKHQNNPKYKDRISKLKKIYKIETTKELLLAIKPHPRSIAAAQAAIESAWATSRFFREANNVFGVWSANKQDSRIAASQKRGSKTIWLRKYTTIEESIKDYYKMLSSSKHFKEFRKLKMKTNNPYKLVEKLELYSEMGTTYTKELSAMIKYNKFYLYDKY